MIASSRQKRAQANFRPSQAIIFSSIRSTRLSPTERRNPRSLKLDELAVGAAVELMLSEEAKVTRALLQKKLLLTKAVRMVARAFQQGGRLFYFGAGTSGRLGVLDASECPPTFRTAPSLVQGIIAGGDVALRNAVEGAEDDADAGAHEIKTRGIMARDVVVGIAASGTTKFVWGALDAAKRHRAKTMLICFNPHLAIPRLLRPDLVPGTGFRAGSTNGFNPLEGWNSDKIDSQSPDDAGHGSDWQGAKQPDGGCASEQR
ncbi:MAG: N-acetylmuramic acid 6-phosphate etherase [Verrucomicrobiota bacterium]